MAGLRDTILALSPVAYWPLEETSGTNADDLVGANDGTYNGAVTLNQGGPAGCSGAPLFGASTSQYVNVPHVAALNMSTALSVQAWAWKTNHTNGFLRVVTKGGYVSNGDEWSLLTNATDGANQGFYGWIRHSGGQVVTPDADLLALSTWHHLAMTYDQVTLRLYANGVQAGSGTATTVTILNASRPLRISQDADTAGPFAGRIAHVAVWNTVLTQAQIEECYRVGVGRLAPPFQDRYDRRNTLLRL